MTDIGFLIIIGLIAGFFGGLLGIGGSVVMIPAMVLHFGADKQHLYQATAMIVNFFVVAPAILRHMQAKALDRPTLRWMIPTALVGAIGGVYLSELSVFRGSGQGWLQLIFAAFLCYVLFENLRRLAPRRSNSLEPEAGPITSPSRTGVIGFATGASAGLLGIGGGLFAVPAQQVLLRLPITKCIANSAATILFSSVLGAVLKSIHLSEHGQSVKDALWMAACLIPTAIIGAWIGAARTHRWPVNVIRIAFSLLVAYSIYRLGMIGYQQVTR